MKGMTVKRSVMPGGDIIEITHRESDPGTWVVRRRRRTFFGLKDISSTWFNVESDAEAFARSGAVPTDRPPLQGFTFAN